MTALVAAESAFGPEATASQILSLRHVACRAHEELAQGKEPTSAETSPGRPEPAAWPRRPRPGNGAMRLRFRGSDRCP
jgi:hypothetical protein